jgi:uncharacterized protein
VRIAVIGAGISGLGAAHLLARRHEVEVFERDLRAGGHSNTVMHEGLALDTGFLVHNVPNYPLLCRLFAELGVATLESNMSFSVSCGGCGLEWSGRRPFAQPRNLGSPRFAALLWEIARWLRSAGPSLQGLDERESLDCYLDRHGYSARFRGHFLVPLTAALWSTAPGRALEYPAASAIRFFENHGMLGARRFRWRTVAGGSRRYVDALAGRLGMRLHLGLGAVEVRRSPDGVAVRTADDRVTHVDAVVIAAHADDALRLLADPSPAETRALGAFAYSVNETVLHTDAGLLPRTPAARASWNYRTGDDGAATVTYWLNSLQRLETTTDYCVTLNAPVAEEAVIARFSTTHPLFAPATPAAQAELRALSGQRRTFFAGAHLGNGFHEAGLASGVEAARALGVEW